ncbi:endolytic transglycosylase MltG [Phycicoccus endophyticus]|uniref:Endolytic murein transglycosylase n=1 Tax=Phycicoccus endophyticus TaxID=1690220 RepID=A0A7G9R475_9MICO|nr:endolytic transglycosylase MltG [Phycicoccus endophyticus]NHI18251.1 endolytic transglycosylase MltG [Phycicoccus endophyticus]QNN50400.1 endolytic transglycosylase MltG [Phycicoccus endophyticus]GGL25213.1 ABC transporter substrate-binding protein [Phycicoccus endophyticus]
MSQDFTETIFGDDTEPRARTRREIHGRHAKPPRRGRRALAVLVAVALIGGAGYAAVRVLGPSVTGLFGGTGTEVDFPGPGEGEVAVQVAEGDTGEDIATTLRDAGVTRTRTAYLEAAATDPRSAAKIQPGTYTLLKGMRGLDAFAVLVDPANRVADRVTLREGLWKDETFARLSEGTGVKVAAYEKAARNTKAIGLPSAAGGDVEGWLFPSTYEFGENTSATAQLKKMVSLTVATLEDAGVPQDQWERTLTIASIVEGEVSGDADRAKVARVILNRLEGGPPSYGLLQMDSTVHYAAQQRGKAGTSDEQRASDSPYNTYKVAGLPPGPIGNPGKASIVAAANPEPGDWVFFVTVDPGTGETKFATTQAEHDRYVQEFQQWCSDHEGQC